jgi:hypothetical protein
MGGVILNKKESNLPGECGSVIEELKTLDLNNGMQPF